MFTRGYKDPTEETLKSGRSVADVLPSRGLRGLKGVIVSKAGVDGRPVDFNPHDRNSISINIEPDGGNPQSFRLADFTKEALNQAVAHAREKIPGNDIEDVRERAAMAFEELAAIANSGVVKKADNAPAVVIPPVPPPVPPAAPPAALSDIDRNYSPMAAFGLKRAQAAPARQVATAQPSTSGPPSKLIYFEKEGIGTVPAFFHDVHIELTDDENSSGFIVLVYDLRYEQAAARWFPPSDDPYKRPWAVQIQNDHRLYLVHTTGFQFDYADREFCILLVERSVTAEG
jgi:hypothetical protein